MSFFQKLKINALVAALAYLVLGILFVLFPGIAMTTICYLLALGLALVGAVYVVESVRHWQTAYRSNGLAIGILALMGALFLFLKADAFIAIIPMALGFLVIVSGVLKVQNAIVLYKMQCASWLYVLIAAALCILLGIALIENPFGAAATLVTLIGIGLIFSGVSDPTVLMLLARRTKNLP